MQQCVMGVLALLLFSFSCTAHALPNAFSGVWESDDKSESGKVNIRIDEVKSNHVRGVITISGSRWCHDAISFHGVGTEKKLDVESDAKIVCGWGGKLFGEVEQVEGGYIGSFRYRFWGATWTSGTFRLTED